MKDATTYKEGAVTKGRIAKAKKLMTLVVCACFLFWLSPLLVAVSFYLVVLPQRSEVSIYESTVHLPFRWIRVNLSGRQTLVRLPITIFGISADIPTVVFAPVKSNLSAASAQKLKDNLKNRLAEDGHLLGSQFGYSENAVAPYCIEHRPRNSGSMQLTCLLSKGALLAHCSNCVPDEEEEFMNSVVRQ
jgi:hypothetical protein